MRQKISLACIAGNAEKYIGRFLDSFQPHFDEVVIVSAIGNQDPDGTMEIAKARGCVTGEYKNQRGSGGMKDSTGAFSTPTIFWPHVDDFAAARNKAFDLASGDLIMWADMDDVISPESAAALLDAISRMPEDCDGLEFPYEVPDDGVTVMRERVIRKGRARWVSPIHEHLVFEDGAKVATCTNGKILHHQIGDRRPNDERNLRILESIPADKRTLSHRFHLFQSLRVCGREEEASQVAVDLLTNPPKEMGDAEKFELFIAAGQMVQDLNTRSNLILQALGTDPSRREGYGEMALCMIAIGKPKSALGFTTAMRSLRQHSDADWNARRKYYRWLGEHIHGMALRANGRIEEADAVETNHFIRHGAKISLLHATRGRPSFAAGNRRKWLETAANPDAIEHIFAIDADDEDSFPLMVHRHIMLKGTGGPVAAWNACAKASAGEVLVQMSDDFHPFQGWDTAILDAIGDTSKPAVLAVSDGHRTDDLLCMAIVTRQRWKDQGELFHPEFFSMYSDNLFSECAFRDGVVIDARDRITFEHFHPAFGKGEMDETYARSNSSLNYLAGEGALRRIREGVRVSTEVGGFCDYRDFYAQVAHTLKPDAVAVEIGSWMGQSAVYLCQRLQDFGKAGVVLHCVDTFKGEENQPVHYAAVAEQGGSIRHVFEGNIRDAQVADMIRIHEGDSAQSAADFADGSLDFIFIDAAHDYDSVVKDLAAWYPKLAPGGIFAGHDYPWHEVKKAVDEHAAANGYTVQAWGRCWIKPPPPKTALAIMAHESAQPTVDLFLPQWRKLDCDLYCSLPHGDEIDGFKNCIYLGQSAYSGREVFRRFTLTLKAMIDTGADQIVVAEYDTVNLRPELPPITPGKVTTYMVEDGDNLCALSPWAMDLPTARKLHQACEAALEAGDYPEGNGLLDRWIGNVIRQARMYFVTSPDCFGYPWKEGAHEQIRKQGINWIHGWKTREEFKGLL